MSRLTPPAAPQQQVVLPDLVSTGVVDLTQAMCEVPSVCGTEAPPAEQIRLCTDALRAWLSYPRHTRAKGIEHEAQQHTP